MGIGQFLPKKVVFNDRIGCFLTNFGKIEYIELNIGNSKVKGFVMVVTN